MNSAEWFKKLRLAKEFQGLKLKAHVIIFLTLLKAKIKIKQDKKHYYFPRALPTTPSPKHMIFSIQAIGKE